jgi:hypothetical protein
MTNEQLKEQIVALASSDERIREQLDMKNKDNLQAHKDAIQAYAEIVSWIISKL